MKITEKELYKLLVKTGHIKNDEFAIVVKEAKEQKKSLEDLLIEKGLINDEQLGSLIAQMRGIPFINLRNQNIDEATLNIIPEVQARGRGVIAFSRDKQEIKVGMINPDDLEIINVLAKHSGQEITAFLITKRDWQEALANYKTNLKSELEKILKQLQKPILNQRKQDQIIIKTVDKLLEYGYRSQASDIHIEPYANKVLVRFRIDGVMHDILEVSKSLIDYILTRIKILAKMRTDEHRSAQDGRFSFTIQKEKVDVRVSIVPVTKGENAVLRILSVAVRAFSLGNIGLAESDLKKVQRIIKNPHGMILVTGPTGSGKTTTIYTIMNVLNTREVHISTIEDPVEYDIEGVSQIQVDSKTNLTFAQGLRAIVRQNPDIIMVGEIRDKETALIAVNSAMTGHLVLSTLHANDAATTLLRLIDMNIEPFLIASTVNIVIAQRLVRKICLKCRQSYLISKKEANIISANPFFKKIFQAKGKRQIKSLRLYRGAGCKICNRIGYRGRIGVFEVLVINSQIQDLIIKRATSEQITKTACARGMIPMLEGSIDKALQGITTLEEVLRVTQT